MSFQVKYDVLTNQRKEITRKETLTLHRFMDRPHKTVRRWVRQSVKVCGSDNLEKSFSSFCSIKTKANVRYIPGCGISCPKTKTIGPQAEVCPKCRDFIWHKECLEKQFQLRNLQSPNFSEDTWSCINCVVKQSFLRKTI